MSAIQWGTIKAAIQTWIVSGSGLPDAQVIWDYQGPGSPARPFITISVQQIDQPAHDYKETANNLFTFDAVTVTPTFSTSRFAAPAHPFTTGDGPVTAITSGTLPSPLALETNYWIIVIDANTIQLAEQYTDTGGNNVDNPITPITITDDGSGTMQLVEVADETTHAGNEIVVTAKGIRTVTFRLQCYGGERSGSLPMQIISDVLASLELNVDALNASGIAFSTAGVADVEGGIKLIGGRLGGQLEPRAIADIVGFVDTTLVGYLGRVDTISITPVATLENGTEQTLPTVEIDAT